MPERVRADLAVVRETFELQRPFEAEAVATNAMLDTSLRLPARRTN